MLPIDFIVLSQPSSLLLIIGSYIIGSISSAVLVSRSMGLADPRTVGSGNPGATNVLRSGNKKAAALTLIGDLAKGLLPLLVARQLQVGTELLCAMALAAIIGHMYPLFLKFKGGKGVATTLGALLGLNPILALVWISLWLAVAKITAYSSLAALIATFSIPWIAGLALQDPSITLASSLIALLVCWRHRGNIRQLIQGKEAKIGKN
ncbi:MAG: glycerol-3-phosphate 1-O-acyltransferase PlsY [Gammaproteobacteria bacterium]|nr:glycerol-3-phosphate 1-O-acyltransferase PlsY [Gammaproteobacteria bacterium]